MSTTRISKLPDPERQFLGQIMNWSMLSESEERDLARRWRDHKDEKARHALVTAYMKLVVATAARFRRYQLPQADMIQEGSIGLLHAANKFDPERETRFSTYASLWVKASIQNYILQNWSIVRSGTSSGQKALFFNLRWMRAKLDRVYAGAGSLSQSDRDTIARRLKVSAEDVSAMATRISGSDLSLNGGLTEDDGSDTFQDLLVDPAPSPEQNAIEKLDSEARHAWLMEAIQQLDPREKVIISERMLNENRPTFDELGEKFGVTKERVRQLEARALRKLQHLMRHKSVAAVLHEPNCCS
ncbi:RNA polymerase factor sigma-32 [Ferrovibrio sp.]|uniref:RNA polymerase factor sigma-32 n=1 Tax=Ferrovibrio sp. TaxID=1917215 RepID=UPI002608AFEE|nr:RNA polymerase factor sigma-32 [Ferrovibrio sp.]